jgi:hypothetical protein
LVAYDYYITTSDYPGLLLLLLLDPLVSQEKQPMISLFVT